MKFHNFAIYNSILTDIQFFITNSIFSIVFGVIIHYLINFPRKRKRFQVIEEQNGPIAYLLNRLKGKYPDIVANIGPKKIYNFYFSILNDEIPTASKERIYYFSSIYYLMYHIGFISLFFIIFNSILFIIESFTIINFALFNILYFRFITFDLYYPSFLQLLILIPLCIIILRKESQGERYLRLMFDIQTNWVERNWSIVDKKFKESFVDRSILKYIDKH
jgi:hypothetical protein